MTSYKEQYEALLTSYVVEEHPVKEVCKSIERLAILGKKTFNLSQQSQKECDQDRCLMIQCELGSLIEVRQSIVDTLVFNPRITIGVGEVDKELITYIEDFEFMNHLIAAMEMDIKEQLLEQKLALI